MDDEPSEATVADGGKATVANGAVKPATESNGSNGSSEGSGNVVLIAPRGDVVLDVVFETSRETLRETLQSSRKKTSHSAAAPAVPQLKPRLLMAFRVESEALKKNSRYFANLLGDTRFQEARTVEAGLKVLALDDIKPADAEISRLPRVRIEDDDEGSHTAGRELVFAELLRILHWDGTVVPTVAATNGDETPDKVKSTTASAVKTRLTKTTATRKATSAAAARRGVVGAKGARSETAAANSNATAPTQPLMPGSRWSAKTPPTLLELATLALQADRFASTDAVTAYVKALRLRFPQPVVRATRGDGIGAGSGANGGSSFPSMANEEAIRQKVFVSWLLDQPLRFHAGTRELVLYGSQRWRAALSGEEDEDEMYGNSNGNGSHGQAVQVPRLPAWWDLPDGIESELQFRRACIVNCIASVPRHFLALYTSRNQRQCKMGYESSAACDSFQLGEIIKFLFHKDLMFLHDFSATTMSRSRGQHRIAPADYAAVDINHILGTLKQCPAYQLDKHHVNCGLRTRLLPILEYIQTMLGAGVVALHRHEWTAVHHGKASWLAAAEAAGLLDGDEHGDDDDGSDVDVDGVDGNGNGDARVPSFGKLPPRSSTGPADPNAPQVFRFTRSMAGDQRLRMEGSMAANRMARHLFTARRWNWTPEI